MPDKDTICKKYDEQNPGYFCKNKHFKLIQIESQNRIYISAPKNLFQVLQIVFSWWW